MGNRIKSLLLNPFDIETIPQEHGHLGLEYIASFQESKGQCPEIIDANFLGWGPDILAREVKKINPHIIGFSLFERGLEMNARLAAQIRKESQDDRLHITAGGLYASLHAETLLKKYPVFDSVVLYDGEETFSDLVDALSQNRPLSSVKGLMYRENHQIKSTPLRQPIMDLDSLPYPKRFILPNQDALAIMASRGCYGRCKFCSTNAFNANMGAPKIRIRSVDSVLEELAYLYDRYKIKKFWFNDANICATNHVQPGWVETLARGIIKRQLPLRIHILCRANDVTYERFSLLKEAGLKQVAIGFESVHSRVLQYFRKDTTPEINTSAVEILKSLQIQVLSAYIMFDPYSTVEEIAKSIDFIVQFNVQFPFYRTPTNRNRLIVYENTEMYESCKRDGLLTSNNYGYQFVNPEVEELWQMVSYWKNYVHNLHRYGRMFELCKHFGVKKIPGILYKLCLDYLKTDESFFRNALVLSGSGVKADSLEFRREAEIYTNQIMDINTKLREMTETLQDKYGIYVWAQEYYQKNKKMIDLPKYLG